MTKTIALAAAILLSTSIASAEGPKQPKRPSVYHDTQCQPVKLKGAMGWSDTDIADVVTKDTAMLCTAKAGGTTRVLRDWRLLGFGDGDMFVVGR